MTAMLRGERVTLRAVERDDLPKIWELRNDAELEGLAYGVPGPRSMAELEERFDRDVADPSPRLESFIIDVDGSMVGRCDLFDADDLARTVRIGITVAKEHWGNGYGTDAVRVMVRHAFVDRNMRKVCLDVLAENERAIRAYRSAGFVEEGLLRQQIWHDGAYRDLVQMGILSQDHPSAKHPAWSAPDV